GGPGQLENEGGDDPEVAAAAPQPPVQLRVVVPARPDDPAVGRDHLEGDAVVAGEVVLAGQTAHPAAQGEPSDVSVSDVAVGGGQAVCGAGQVEGAEQRASLHPRPAVGRIDRDLIHRGQVDHQPVLRDGVPDDAVAAAADPDLQVLLAAVPDGGGDVVT